jgi:hypothetical protein
MFVTKNIKISSQKSFKSDWIKICVSHFVSSGVMLLFTLAGKQFHVSTSNDGCMYLNVKNVVWKSISTNAFICLQNVEQLLPVN